MAKRFTLAAGGAIVVASCVGGTGGGGWEQAGWFGSDETVNDAGHRGFPDVTLPPGAGGGTGGGQQPKAPSCGTADCNAGEICVQAASGLTCVPTCINAVSCPSGCCVQAQSPSGDPVGYCGPKSSCCGDTGANCGLGQLCVTPPHGTTECVDTCSSSKDCSKTLCCATLKNDAGACMYMSEVDGTCRP